MENKRGQGLSTNAIILIILGVAILVILIIGFTIGWSTLVPFLRTDNVDTIVKSCETSCSTQSKFSYCSKVMELQGSENDEVKATCYLLEKVPQFDKYGLGACSLSCSKISACTDISYTVGDVAAVKAVKQTTDCDTATQLEVTDLANDLQTGEKCCIAK